MVPDVKVAELGAEPQSVAREGGDPVSRETQGAKTVGETGEGVNADLGDVVVGDVEVAQVLQLAERLRDVVQAVPLQVEELQGVLNSLEGILFD